jgi:Ca2+-binding EF-hand superfamily protein
MNPRLALLTALGAGALVALLLLPAPQARTASNLSPIAEKDGLELVFLGDRQLLRLAVHVEIDGKLLAVVWDTALRRLFDYLDRNGDGKLDRKEAARAPSALRIRQLSWGYFSTQQDTPIAWKEFAGDEALATISFERFAAYYRRHGLGLPMLAVGVEPPESPLTRALLRHLDRKGEGRVSRRDWEAAEQTLASLDLNEDEVISPDELVADVPYPSVQGTNLLTPAAQGQRPDALRERSLLLPLPQGQGATWAEEVVRRRDRNGDSKLDRVEAGLPPATFAALDRDGDGFLDAAELANWPTLLEDRDLVIRLGRLAEGQAALEWRSAGKVLAQALPGELLRADLAGTHLALGLGSPRVLTQFAGYRTAARQRFKEADGNGAGIVDSAEARRSTFAPLRTQFDLADRDQDGKLTAAEWDAWLDLQEALLAGQVVLSVVDQGRGLFEFLDADRDGRLSRRELRSAWQRLSAAGCVEGESVRLDRLPRQILAAVGVGTQRLPLTLTRRAGPAWFRAMDRNGDGDVSLREFLGPLKRFHELDTDGDGLISPEEAEQVRDLRP